MIALSLALAYLGTIGLVAFYLWLTNARAERSLRASWLETVRSVEDGQRNLSRAFFEFRGTTEKLEALEKRIADLEKRDALRRSP